MEGIDYENGSIIFKLCGFSAGFFGCVKPLIFKIYYSKYKRFTEIRKHK